MNRIILVGFVLIVLSAVFLGGCASSGGGGGSSPNDSHTGSIAVSVQWPDRPQRGEARIDPNVRSFKIFVFPGELEVSFILENWQTIQPVVDPAELVYPQTSTTIENVPIGSQFLYIVGFDAGGNPISNAYSYLEVTPGVNAAPPDAVNIPYGAEYPAVTSLNPSEGNVGDTISILGSGFCDTAEYNYVYFNGVEAQVVSWSNYEIVCTVPEGATSGPVVVSVWDQDSNGVLFTVIHPPVLNSITPSSGQPGVSVTLQGAYFGEAQNDSAVTFNGLPATATSWSDGEIICAVPEGATSGPVIVTVGGTASNAVDFTVETSPTPTPTPPSISSISPDFGPISQSVTIFGSGFGDGSGESYVTFNGVTATVSSWTDAEIVCTVPDSATTGPVIVTVNSLSSNPAAFSVINTPYITSVDPTFGAAGTEVNIYGFNFGDMPAGTIRPNQLINVIEIPNPYPGTVTFNGYPGFISFWSNTHIVVRIVRGASSGPLVVTVNGVSSNEVPFTVYPAPFINSITPSAALPGDSVTISGSHFGAAQLNSTVTFNGTAVIQIQSWTDTSIACIVPAGATNGNVIVTVTGFESNPCSFIIGRAPAISLINPSSGSPGSMVTIIGSDFGAVQGSSFVTFNGLNASVSVWGDTSIEVFVPNTGSGYVTVTVNGMISNNVNFTVTTAAPLIISLNPASGQPGDPITIMGTGFGATQGTSSVNFNGFVPMISSWTDTSITCEVPGGATSGPVSVIVNDIQSNGVDFVVTASAPVINALMPPSAAWDQTFTIQGTGFGAMQGASTVNLNGMPLSPMSWSDTSIDCMVPSGASSGPVFVTVNGITSNEMTLIIMVP